MQFGDYQLINNNNGTMTIEWFDKESNRKLRHSIINFHQVLYNLCQEQFQKHKECAELYRQYQTDILPFLANHKDIIENIPFESDKDFIPGELYQGQQLEDHNLKRFVEGFNVLHKTNLSFTEVKLYIK